LENSAVAQIVTESNQLQGLTTDIQAGLTSWPRLVCGYLAGSRLFPCKRDGGTALTWWRHERGTISGERAHVDEGLQYYLGDVRFSTASNVLAAFPESGAASRRPNRGTVCGLEFSIAFSRMILASRKANSWGLSSAALRFVVRRTTVLRVFRQLYRRRDVRDQVLYHRNDIGCTQLASDRGENAAAEQLIIQNVLFLSE
jgi:hypothetical protein